MRKGFAFFAGVFALWLFPAESQELSCRHIHYIQKQFLKNHISGKTLGPALKDQVLSRFIKSLDREKIYFLRSDISNIKKRNKRLFSDLKRQKCSGLYYIYNIYSKRVNERLDFANQYLKGDFAFKKDLKYTLDSGLKKPPMTSQEANQRMEGYIQYQTANVFLFEKDLKKSIRQVSHILNNTKKQVLSWKPRLNRKERRDCQAKSRHSFKACKPTKWLSHYLNAYSQSLDSHSSYMDSEDMEEFYISMNLELEGIGATLSSRFGYTVVEKLVPGGAAEKSKKIKPQDKILAVGQSAEKLIDIFGERIEDVVSIIRGSKGSPVFLKILREDKNGQNKSFVVRLIRDRVDLKEEEASISYHNIQIKGQNRKVGLLKTPSFYGSSGFGKSVTRDVKRLLISAKKENINALVLDLSHNRGGSLEEAVDLSGLFFAEGNVVKQSEKNRSRPQIFRDRDKRIFWTGPLIVLVNRLSASASEIVSGTLQDYNRAVIVGADHTFGKGSVQSVEPQSGRLGALKTTVGLYFIPSGKSTQKDGVQSDIALPSVYNIDELGEKSLDKALPSKTIKSFKSSSKEIFSKNRGNWRPITDKIIETLKASSQKRVSQSEKFQKIQKRQKEMQKKAKNQKAVTIAEILERKGDEDQEGELTEEELSQTEQDQKKYFDRPDIQEALAIAGELALIQKTARAGENKIL